MLGWNHGNVTFGSELARKLSPGVAHFENTTASLLLRRDTVKISVRPESACPLNKIYVKMDNFIRPLMFLSAKE